MVEVNIKEARSHLSELVSKAEKGEEILITRHGKRVAMLGPSISDSVNAPGLSEFRASINIKGKGLSQTIIESREEERY
ncbi:unnamed protein product [marine sediment metagenome]|uniref:Antitoxin n=1 Tax=marine sediment metagenome TaxID=412755 RepID=X1CS58_9ZZZZ